MNSGYKRRQEFLRKQAEEVQQNLSCGLSNTSEPFQSHPNC